MVYRIWESKSTKFVKMMILGRPLTFSWYGQIYILVAVAILVFADMQSLFLSGELIMAHGPLIYAFALFDLNHNSCGF